MRKIFVGMMLLMVLFFQGCQTTGVKVCKVCHPEEARMAEEEAAKNRENPFIKMDTWMQEHMW